MSDLDAFIIGAVATVFVLMVIGLLVAALLLWAWVRMLNVED